MTKRGAIARLFGLGIALFSCATSARAAELVVFHERGCPWCATWEQAIGAIYHKTDEARALPLRRVDIHGERPADLRDLKEPIQFAPTFVVVGDDGREVGRITGYPGEEFFWFLLGELRGKLAAGD